MIKASLWGSPSFSWPAIGVPFVWKFPMRRTGTLWHQIHELANLVDRHAVEQSVYQLVAALHALPTATRTKRSAGTSTCSLGGCTCLLKADAGAFVGNSSD